MDFNTLQDNKAALEELQKKLLDLDSEFRFECRKCGKCCRHQDTILFNTRDIFRIAKTQNRSLRAVVEDYTEIYLGPSSHFPVVHLLPRGPKEACPLLTPDGRCSVHDCKPTVCALYPLGRVFLNEIYGEPLSSDAVPAVRYLLNDTSCGSGKHVYTVRKWLERFGIPEEDTFYIQWSQLIADLASAIYQAENQEGKPVYEIRPIMRLIEQVFVPLLYFDYDTKEEFLPQFERNTSILRQSCQLIRIKWSDATGSDNGKGSLL